MHRRETMSSGRATIDRVGSPRVAPPVVMATLVAIGVATACVGNDPVLPGSQTDAAAPGVDATSAVESGSSTACDLTKPFGAPEPVTALNSPQAELAARLSASGLAIYLATARPGSLGGVNVWRATRATSSDAFSAPVPLAGVNSDQDDDGPSPSADEQQLYLDTRGQGLDIVRATRTDPTKDFGAPSAVAALTSGGDDSSPYLLGGALYFSSTRGGPAQVFRAPLGGSGPGVVALAYGSGMDNLLFPVVASDERSLYFGADRTDATARGLEDIWIVRGGGDGTFAGTPVAVTELNTSSREWPTSLSADGCTLYFISDRAKAGDLDVWRATRAR